MEETLETLSERVAILVKAEDMISVAKVDPIRVLHVDADPSTLEVSKQILITKGNFEIEHALCVEEASRKLSSGHYDVIVSDYEMPQKNGLDFLKELKEQKKDIPFILFTGRGREEVAIKALNLGAEGYYDKQGNPETVYGELAHGITKVANHKSAENSLAEAHALTNSVFNSTEDMIWSVSASNDFRLLTFNKSVSDYFLKTQNLCLKVGMSTKEIMPTEELIERWRELNRRALEEGSFTIEYTTLKSPRILELTFNVLKRKDEPFGIAVFGKDITEQRKAKRQYHPLKRNSEQYLKTCMTLLLTLILVGKSSR